VLFSSKGWGLAFLSRFLVIGLVFFALKTVAHGEVHVDRAEVHTRTGLHVILTFPEKGLFKVAQFKVFTSGLQEKISEEAYGTMARAQKRGAELLMIAKRQEVPVGPRRAEFANTSVNAGVIRGGHGIYPAVAEWDETWEQKYADWLRAEFKPDFFVKHNIVTDCADVAFSLRWIFSRINGLRMATTLSASNRLLTNDSRAPEWDKLPTAPEWYADRKFLAALNYIQNNTYTHSLQNDTFPVAMARPYFREGVIELHINDSSGHTLIMNYIARPGENYQIPGSMLWSTLPPAVRPLEEGLFYPSQPGTDNFSFRQFRWPQLVNNQVQLVREANMPGYSLEQFDDKYYDGYPNFTAAVMAKLFPDYSPIKIVEKSILELTDMIKSRTEVVEEGYVYCKTHDCKEGSTGYEDWSTPSRDKRLGQVFKRNRELVTQLTQINGNVEVTFLEGRLKPQNIRNVQIPLQIVELIWDSEIYSSEPTVEPAKRWNLSSPDLAEYIIDRVGKLLASRESKVNSKSATNLEDSELLKLYNVYEIYRTLSADAGNLKDRLNLKKIFAHGEERSVVAWLMATQGFDSNPESVARWGEATPKYLFLPEERGLEVINESGWSLSSGNPKKLKNILTGEVSSLPANFDVQSLSPFNDLVQVNDGASPSIYDLKTKQVIRLATSRLNPLQSQWISANTLMLLFVDALVFFDVSGNSSRLIFEAPIATQGADINFKFNEKGVFLTPQSAFYYDFSSARQKVIKLDLQPPMEMPTEPFTKFVFKGEINGRVLLSSSETDDYELYVVDLLKQTIQLADNSLRGIDIFDFPYGMRMSNANCDIGHFISDFQFVTDQAIPNCMGGVGRGRFFYMYAGRWRILERVGTQYKDVVVPTGYSIFSVSEAGNGAAILQKDDRQYLMDLSTRQIIAEASKIRAVQAGETEIILLVNNERPESPQLYNLTKNGELQFYGQASLILRGLEMLADTDRYAFLGVQLESIYDSEMLVGGIWPIWAAWSFIRVKGASLFMSNGKIPLWVDLP
jgi:hypothetical protein